MNFPVDVSRTSSASLVVAGGDRDVLAHAERIELIDPVVVVLIGAAHVAHTLEAWAGRAIECPAFRAMLAGCGWPVEGALALAAVEAGKMAAGKDSPNDAVAVDVQPAWGETLHGAFGLFQGTS
jgi:hypothetical protein